MEPRDIAHRLHDGPVQDLTAALLLVGALQERLDADDEASALAARAASALESAAQGCRVLIRDLDPDDGDP